MLTPPTDEPQAITVTESNKEYVYFIQSPQAIKIGWSTNPIQRCHDLQAANAEQLHLLDYFEVSDGLEEEQWLHRKFKHLRIRGEWFKATPEILDYVRARGGGELHSLRDIILQVAADRKARKAA